MTREFGRREFFRTVGAGALAFGGVTHEGWTGEVAAQERRESWPQFGNDSKNSGYVPDRSGPADGVVEQWHFPELGTVNRLDAIGATAYVGTDAGQLVAVDAATGTEQWRFTTGDSDTLFPTAAGDAVFVGGTGGTVYALDRQDGSERWHFDTGSNGRSSPTVSGDTAYISADRIYALDAADGSERWRYDPDSRPVSRAAVDDTTVYIGTRDNAIALDTADGTEQWTVGVESRIEQRPAIDSGTVYVGTDDGVIAALDATDGTESWTATVDGLRVPLAAEGDTLYVGGEQTIYALDAARGAERWTFDPSGTVGSAPALVDGTVYVGGPVEMYALRATDGELVWEFETDTWVRTSTVADGRVFVGSDSTVFGLDRDTGTESWRFGLSGEMQAPVLADGSVYVGNTDGSVYRLDATDGSERWQTSLGRIRSSAAVSDGRVYVGSMDDNLYALDAADGSEQWRFETGSFVQSAPTLVDGTVYFGSVDESVYALDAVTGSQQWQFDAGRRIESSPAVTNGTVYTQNQDGVVHAIDAADGTRQWRFETGDYPDPAPAAVDGSVYVASGETIYALDADTGTEEWRFATEFYNAASPAVTDERVLLSNDVALDRASGTEQWTAGRGNATTSPVVADGVVYTDDAAYDLTDGNERWSLEGSISATDSPVVANGRVYVGSRDGRVYAYGPGVDASVTVPALALVGESLSFSASDSETTADSLRTVEWQFGSDASFSEGSETTTHTFDDAGTYTVRLRVTDAAGHTDTTSRTIQVHADRPSLGSSEQSAGTTSQSSPEQTDTPGGQSRGTEPTAPGSSGSDATDRTGIDTRQLSVAVLGAGVAGGIGLGAYRRFSRTGTGAGTTTEDGVTETAVGAGKASEGGDGAADGEDEPSDTEDDGGSEAADTEDDGTEQLSDDGAESSEIPATPALQLMGAADAVTLAEPVNDSGTVRVFSGELATVDQPVRLLGLDPAADEAVADLFSHHCSQWESISHNPHIATVHASGTDPWPWVAFESSERCLSDAIDELGPDDRADIIDAVVDALTTAGLYNISHDSVAPDTVRLPDNTDEPAVTVSDWGLTPAVETAAGTVPVTPYTAPEQLDGETTATTDCYRVGLLAYRLLADRAPFADAEDTAAAIRRGDLLIGSDATSLEPGVAAVIETATATDPDSRYDSLTAFRDALRRQLD